MHLLTHLSAFVFLLHVLSFDHHSLCVFTLFCAKMCWDHPQGSQTILLRSLNRSVFSLTCWSQCKAIEFSVASMTWMTTCMSCTWSCDTCDFWQYQQFPCLTPCCSLSNCSVWCQCLLIMSCIATARALQVSSPCNLHWHNEVPISFSTFSIVRGPDSHSLVLTRNPH